MTRKLFSSSLAWNAWNTTHNQCDDFCTTSFCILPPSSFWRDTSSPVFGCSVVVVFVEPVIAMYGISHMLAGVLNTPKTAAMMGLGYEYDEVERQWYVDVAT